MERRRARNGLVLAVALSVVLGACGGSKAANPPASDTPASNPSSEPAVTTTTATSSTVPAEIVRADGTVDEAALGAELKGVLALPVAGQADRLAALDTEVEREAWRLSGMDDALGGKAAADEAFAASGTALVQAASAQRGGQVQLLAYRPAADEVPEAQAGEGLFGGYMAEALLADALVTGSNGGAFGSGKIGDDASVTVSRGSVELALDLSKTIKGVDNRLVVASKIAPCPDATGKFEATAKVDVSATTGNGATGQKATLDMKVTGYVDDDAKLTGFDTDYRMQMADFVASRGQYADLSGSYAAGAFTASLGRTGGAVTPKFLKGTLLTGAVLSLLIGHFLAGAAEKGWTSGRCVYLEPKPSAGPHGLKPSASVSVLAAPRSQLDGGVVGGSVTATLTGGAASVSPSDTKVPADASFTYVAPDEKDKSGSVGFEARGRGVAKAAVTFDTKATNAYVIVGGLDDFQANQLVCDIMAPFTLDGGGFSVQFSGGLTGTYTYSGVFAASGNGEYSISLPDGPGQPGTMVGGGAGSIAGNGGSGTEHYTLTPAPPCS